MKNPYIYDGSLKYHRGDVKPDDTSLCKDKEKAASRMQKNLIKIDELQRRLYAEKKEGVIFLFQAMDAAGKDGTIQAVLQCLSPHGVYEAAFKSPSSAELSHDFLWRIEQKVPAKGEIAIFNRSHYEDVLIGKVKKLYETQAHADRIKPDHIIAQRYQDIVNYETYLYHNSVRTVKFFLNVSKTEQAERFLARIEEPQKNWKFNGGDYEERQYWDAYQDAFADAINATATPTAPWYVIPADHKWYMRYVVSEIILSVMEDMDPQYPVVTEERLAEFEGYRQDLLKDLGMEKTATRQKEDR